ncbi:MAG: hypothetical protein WCJ27_01245, partial [Verrucomicrobiota bacterium]
MRFWLLLALLALATPTAQAHDIVLISGGPALRSFERYRTASHDKYWGNFIDSAILRAKELQLTVAPTDQIVWLVFRPSYQRRSQEDQDDYLKILEERGLKAGITPIYFDNKTQLFTLLRRDGS